MCVNRVGEMRKCYRHSEEVGNSVDSEEEMDLS